MPGTSLVKNNVDAFLEAADKYKLDEALRERRTLWVKLRGGFWSGEIGGCTSEKHSGLYRGAKGRTTPQAGL